MAIKLASIDEAVSLLTDQDVTVSAEKVRLDRTNGRVLAEDILSARPMPPFRRSAFDGYVMRCEDIEQASQDNPVTLCVLETVTAGDLPSCDLPPGTAMRIMTGAMCPDNGTCVIKYEETDFADGKVTVYRSMRREQNVIQIGEEYPEGELLIPAGTVLDPARAGIIATQGYPEVSVYCKPDAAVISVGSELQEVGTELKRGNIYSSSWYTLAGYLEKDGVNVTSSDTISDDPARLAERIDQLTESNDIIFTTGGASNGDHDYASQVMEMLGFKMLFRKVDMKPGACMLAGVRDGKILVSLSGSPGAALTSYLRVVRPLVLKMTGRREIYPEVLKLPLEQGIDRPILHTKVVKGNIAIGGDGKAYFRETPRQLNGMIYGFAGINLIADVPVTDKPTPAGTVVECRRLSY